MKLKREEKFQIVLVILVFLLTMIGSSISGYTVYRLTQDRSPLIVVSWIKRDTKTNDVLLGLYNYKENPANNVQLTYESIDLNFQKKETFPSLYKKEEPSLINISWDEISNRILLKAKEFIQEEEAESPWNWSNYSFKIYFEESDEIPMGILGQWRIYTFPLEYKVKVSAQCKNCKNEVIQLNCPYILYKVSIECDQNNGNLSCDVLPRYISCDSNFI